MSPRRKRIVITIDEKRRAIERVEKGELMKTIADELNVGTSTVSDWIKSKEKFANLRRSSRYKPKIIRTGVYEAVNEALFLWFIQQREKNAPISGPSLKAKAAAFAVNLGDHYKSFTASEGWLSKWKNRYDIKQLGTNGEKTLADENVENRTDECGKEFEEIRGEYFQDQIFSAAEAGLYFKMLPAQSSVPEYDNSASSCQPITVLLCTNASGECRLPLMVIGKSKNPSLSKNIDKNNLPLYYKHLKHAWMSPTLFNNWFREHFAPKVKIYLESKGLPPKAILFLDNAPVHPDVQAVKNEDIIARYVSSKLAGFLQPFDHNVAEIFKKHYRLLMLRSILETGSRSSSSFLENLKSVSMKDALFWSAKAWKMVKCTTVNNYWKKLFDEIPKESDEILDLELTKLAQQIPGCESITAEEVTEWVNCDKYRELTDDEILNIVNKAEKDEDSEDKPQNPVEQQRIYSVEAFQDSQLHFEDSQFEQNRADGRKLLKWNAVPTVFSQQNPAKPLKNKGKTRKILAAEKDEAETSVISEAQNITKSDTSLEIKKLKKPQLQTENTAKSDTSLEKLKETQLQCENTTKSDTSLEVEKLKETQLQCDTKKVTKEPDAEESHSQQNRGSKRSISQLDSESTNSNDTVPLKKIKCEPLSPEEIPLDENTEDAFESMFYQMQDGTNADTGTEEQEKQRSGSREPLDELDFEVSQPHLNYAEIKDILHLDDEPSVSSAPKFPTRIKREPMSPERRTPLEHDASEAKSSTASERLDSSESDTDTGSESVEETKKINQSPKSSKERVSRYPLRKRVERIPQKPKKTSETLKEKYKRDYSRSYYNMRQRGKQRKKSKLQRQRELLAKEKSFTANFVKQIAVQAPSSTVQNPPICTISNVVGASVVSNASTSGTQIATKPLVNQVQSGAKNIVVRKELRMPPGLNIASLSKIIAFKMISVKKGEATPAKDVSQGNCTVKRTEIRAPPKFMTVANLPRLIRLKKIPTTEEEIEREAALQKEIEKERVLEKERQQKAAALWNESQQKAAFEKERQQRVVLEKERQEKAALEKEKEQKAALEKEKRHKAALEKEEEQNTALEERRLIRLEKLHTTEEEIEREAALQKDTEKERQQKAALWNERQQKAALEKERQQKAALEKEKGHKAALEKGKEQKTTLEKRIGQIVFYPLKDNAKGNCIGVPSVMVSPCTDLPFRPGLAPLLKLQDAVPQTRTTNLLDSSLTSKVHNAVEITQTSTANQLDSSLSSKVHKAVEITQTRAANRLDSPLTSKVHKAVEINYRPNVENKTNSEDCSPPNKEGEHGRRPSRRAAQLAVKKIQNIARNLATTPSELPEPRGPSPEPVRKPASTYLKTQVKKIRETPRPVISPPVDVGLDMECYEEMLSVIQAKTLMKAQAEYSRVVKTLKNLKGTNARIVCLLNDDIKVPTPVVPPTPPQTKVAAVVSSSNSHSSNMVNLNTITQSSNCTITVVPVRLVAVHSSGAPGTPQPSVTVMKPSLSSTLTTSSSSNG